MSPLSPCESHVLTIVATFTVLTVCSSGSQPVLGFSDSRCSLLAAQRITTVRRPPRRAGTWRATTIITTRALLRRHHTGGDAARVHGGAEPLRVAVAPSGGAISPARRRYGWVLMKVLPPRAGSADAVTGTG